MTASRRMNAMCAGTRWGAVISRASFIASKMSGRGRLNVSQPTTKSGVGKATNYKPHFHSTVLSESDPPLLKMLKVAFSPPTLLRRHWSDELTRAYAGAKTSMRLHFGLTQKAATGSAGGATGRGR